MNSDPKIQAHLNAFNDPREGVRVFSARKVAQYGPQVAPLLIDLLKETHGFTQDCAALALQEMGATAVPFLVEAMRTGDRSTRWVAASILSSMGEEARKAVNQLNLGDAAAAG